MPDLSLVKDLATIFHVCDGQDEDVSSINPKLNWDYAGEASNLLETHRYENNSVCVSIQTHVDEDRTKHELVRLHP